MPSFWRWRELRLPTVVPLQPVPPDDSAHGEEWKPQLLAAALCGLLGLFGALVPQSQSVARQLLFLAAFVAGAWHPAIETWERLRNQVLDVHFLMLAVAAGSAAIGAWEEGVALLFLFSFSGGLEHYAMGRTQREIRALLHATPTTAILVDAKGEEQIIDVDRLAPGMRLLVKPGQLFAVDAEIVRGATAADESNLTGEATPVDKKTGDEVLGGSLNLWGAVEALVTRPARQSSLQKMIDLIREAQRQKAPSQRFTDRFSSGYTFAVLGLTLVMFLAWWLVMDYPPWYSTATTKSAFYRAMTLLVVASPCALVLSIPSAILAAIAWAARHGILFRGGAAVEKLAEVSVVAMDKTGTLTTGDLRVERIESLPPGAEERVAQLAYSIERLSTHPLGRAIVRHGKQSGIEPLEITQIENAVGHGIQGLYGGLRVKLGKHEWVMGGSSSALETHFAAEAPGVSEIWLTAGSVVGRLLLRDDIRDAARPTVAALQATGKRTVVLTGDRHAAAEHLRVKLGIDDVRAELSPEAKVAAIREFQQSGARVAMIGDGVNDAASLAAAHVGIAMGARGSDAALEQADVVLMHDRIENVLAACELSQRARQIIRQNLAISIGVAVALTLAALTGGMPLTLAVIGHEGSTVIVVLNSLRLLLTPGQPAEA